MQHNRSRLVRSVAFWALLGASLSTSLLAGPGHSVARQWNEETLDAIRNDFARPTIHARNLFHVAVAMWDAWATYDPSVLNYLHLEKIELPPVQVRAARDEAISFAAYRLLHYRYADSPGAEETLQSFDDRMDALGYDRTFEGTTGPSAAALGNRVAASVIDHYADDHSNEENDYANDYYKPLNLPLFPDLPGNPLLQYPNRWQPLVLDFFIDQGGNVVIGGFPDFLSPEWGQVTPFALSPADLTIYHRSGFDYWAYHDPGSPPAFGSEYYKWGTEMVALWSGHLDPADGVMIDISPGALGNSPLPHPDDYETYYDQLDGGDSGTGYRLNPVTGLPYDPQLVPRGDYARVLAEFWADGPDSETPPGHWFTIANYVSDQPTFERRFHGRGPMLKPLEWDVKTYLILGAAMHDSAIAAWGVKGWYDYIRPVSALRFMAGLGQSSDPGGPSYDRDGIRLYPGRVEVVTAETTAPGERHEHLAGSEGKIALYAWRGPGFILDPETDVAGVGWILADNWWPYQRPSFVTPPFAGYVSGHSTYSRAASEVLTQITGSPYFPGGLGEFQCPAQEFLVFEDGPSIDITLQWASYYDASDQTSLSRIWGGIHPPADDLPGRQMGAVIGAEAVALGETYFGNR